MKAKLFFLTACAVAVMGLFIGGRMFSTNAQQVDSNLLRGVVQMEIIEPTKDNPNSVKRFYIEKCNGQDCDFESLRQAERDRGAVVPTDLQIQHIFLEDPSDKVNFGELLHKEVIFRGQGQLVSGVTSGQVKNRFRGVVSRAEFVQKNTVSNWQAFTVQAVEKVIPGPVVNNAVNNITADPLILPPPTVGQRKVLVVLVNFQVDPITPYTPQQIKNWVFTGNRSVKRYFEEGSFYSPSRNQGMTIVGNNDVAGDVTPWLSLTGPQTDCATGFSGPWRLQADALAEAAGYSKTQYPTRVMLFAPIPNCSLNAFAFTGTFGDTSQVRYAFMTLGTGSEAWLEYSWTTLVHEMEHTFGIGEHSGGQQSEGSPIIEYADCGDPMGSCSSKTLNAVVNRLKFQWAGSSRMYPVIQSRKPFGAPYVFKLQSPAIGSKGIGINSPPVGAYILLRDQSGQPNGKAFILEYRYIVGQWEWFGTDMQTYNNGLAIRLVESLDLSDPMFGSIIQNTTPSESCCKSAPLKPVWPASTKTWTSQLYGVTITAHAGTRTGMLVEVSLGANYPMD